MKKYNKGFTLTEVLLTLAIVGVVMALTAPSLMTNMSKKTITVSLARAVSIIETGMTNIIYEAQRQSDDGEPFSGLSAITVGDITGGSNSKYLTANGNGYYFEQTNSYLQVQADSSYNTSNITGFGGASIASAVLSNLSPYKFENQNSVVLFQTVSANSAADDETDIIARVIIDANGSDNPNQFGKDIFLFGLTNGGKLIPAGVAAYYAFDKNAVKDACASSNSSAPGNGLSCAARVMADKWEINYY